MDLAGQGNRPLERADGYAMAALLVGLAVMAVLMSVALPVWSQMAKREKEEELIWRGTQYARAVGLFQRKYANTFPPTLDVLIEQRFLRKKYKDPITNDDFQLIPASGGAPTPGLIPGGPGAGGGGGAPPGGFGGRGTTPPTTFTPTTGTTGAPAANTPGGNLNLGISGVVSKSKDASIKIYNGRQRYNEWTFVYLQTSQGIGGGVGGSPVPGRGGRGQGPFQGGPNAPNQPFPGGGPFGPGSPGLPGGRGGMPPLPPGRGFQPVGPQGQPPFGVPQGQSPFGVPQGQSPFGVPQGQAPGRPPVQPFGKPPGN